MMPEGDDETHPQPPAGAIGPGGVRRNEADLLSERRARRAAETGELALTRRAEAAEATVQTLETHVATLQLRLSEAEDERAQVSELLEAERAAARESAHELKRVKQREYAEQQLRVEAEERLVGSDRDRRLQSEKLTRRLNASEHEAAELAESLDRVQRQLAEAEQAAAAERAAVRRGEQQLLSRLGELERRAVELHRGLAAERQARERSERLLETMRLGHRQMQEILGDVKSIVEGRGAAAPKNPPAPAGEALPAPVALLSLEPSSGGSLAPAAPTPRAPTPTFSQATMHDVFAEVRHLASADSQTAGESRGVEMADALAAAVERLRARAEAAAPVEVHPSRPTAARAPHKHSMSLIRRLLNRRKQRRKR
jgi:hypothetical protein